MREGRWKLVEQGDKALLFDVGDDIPEVQAAVKRALERCCLQLKSKIVKQRALADDRERRKNLTKYIPDVSRALFGVPSSIAQPAASAAEAASPAQSSAKRPA